MAAHGENLMAAVNTRSRFLDWFKAPSVAAPIRISDGHQTQRKGRLRIWTRKTPPCSWFQGFHLVSATGIEPVTSAV